MEQHISVTDPIGSAIERVRQVLFRPFDLGKWFTIGFCAWLAQLGENGSGGNFNFNGNSGRNNGDFHRQMEHAHDFIVQNLYWILPLAIFILAAGLAMWAVFLWLNCRGKFMFLHCVALNRADVREPWHKYSDAANSLFWFRFVVGLIGMFLTLPFVILMGILTFTMFLRDGWNVAGVMALVGIGLGIVILSIFFLLFRKLTKDFVVPIMYLRGTGCVEAWKEFLGMFGQNLGHFVLYLLFQIVLGIVIAVLVLFLFVITCCFACCLASIPYIGTVLLLPIIMFRRAYSLYYFAQYGPAYNVFPPTAPAPPAPPPTY